MIPHSSLYEQAVRYSNTMKTVVDIYVNGVRTYPNVPVTDGTVTCDRNSAVRWTASIELGVQPWEEIPLVDAYKTRFRVYRGISSLGRTEMLQLGEYRVETIGRSERGRIQLTGSDLMSYVVDARFIRPRVPPTGTSTLAAIRSLLTEGVPGTSQVVTASTKDRKVLATAPWERDRIDAIEAIATSIGVEAFSGYDGRFWIKDIPSTSRPAVFLLNQGTAGVQVNQSIKSSRDGVFNAVSASGQSTDQSKPPVWGWWADMDPTSPTYWNGPFGQKPRFYSSQYLYTNQQCIKAARSMLAEATSVNRSMSIDALSICFLEAGDVVQVTMLDGSVEKHMLQTVEYGLRHNGMLRCETSLNKQLGDTSGGA